MFGLGSWLVGLGWQTMPSPVADSQRLCVPFIINFLLNGTSIGCYSRLLVFSSFFLSIASQLILFQASDTEHNYISDMWCRDRDPFKPGTGMYVRCFPEKDVRVDLPAPDFSRQGETVGGCHQNSRNLWRRFWRILPSRSKMELHQQLLQAPKMSTCNFMSNFTKKQAQI